MKKGRSDKMSLIRLKDSTNLEKVEELLKREGIEFETGNAFEHFCFEEADFRLGNHEEYEEVEFPEELRSEIEGRIANHFYEYDILDYDYMDNIVCKNVEQVLKENHLTLESFKKLL